MNASIRRQIKDGYLQAFRQCPLAKSAKAGQDKACNKCPAKKAGSCEARKTYNDLKDLAKHSNPIAAIALRDKISLEEAFNQVKEILNECLQLISEGEADLAESEWISQTGLEIDYLCYCIR